VKINLAKSAGFCFGVKRALDIALETAKSTPQVYMLGDIVHNEDVVREVEKSGIKKIEKLGKGRGKTLLIRAHGSARQTFVNARRRGWHIVDATCPMVKEIHQIAQDMEEKGYKVIVIGDRKHDEVQGIVGQLKGKAVVIDDIKRIPFKIIKRIKKAAVVVQSTQNLQKVREILAVLKSQVKELRFFNTICKPTRLKQEEIRAMPLENEVMIIIGSKTSANTKRLYEISRSINPRSYWVSNKEEIERAWFRGVKSAGVTAGASTPELTTQAIIDKISKIGKETLGTVP